jgi:FSR family fosmidomycin resistance protein-like MFS transporter
MNAWSFAHLNFSTADKKSALSARKQLWLLTFAHAVVDTYALTLSHLLPLLLRKFAIPATSWDRLTGVIIAVSAAFNSLNQVTFGLLSDRIRTIHILTFGIALTAVCTSLLGVVPTFFLLLVLLAIGGLGVAAFHPQAAVQAASLAKQGKGFGVSLFITGGNVGQAVGPFCIMLLLSRSFPDFWHRSETYGLNWLIWCVIPGLAVALLVAKTLTLQPTGETVSASEESGAKKESFGQLLRPNLRTLIVLYLITTLRTVTTLGLVNFLSLELDAQGYPNLVRSAVIASFTFAGSMGIMVGGWLSDRLNRYALLLFSLLIAPPLFYTALYLLGNSLHTIGIQFWGFNILLFAGNFILSSSITVNIVLSQESLPGHENIASSFMMGAAWGFAGFLNYPISLLGERFGRMFLLNGLALLPLLTSILMVFLKWNRQSLDSNEVQIP